MAQYQPAPRFHQTAAQVGHKTYLWGGVTEDFFTTGLKTLPFEIETFDTFSETWTKKTVTGAPPPGLCNGGFAVAAETLYHFGGNAGYSPYSSLHSLNTVTLEWRELQSKNPTDQPMPKISHGMVTYREETVGVTSLAVLAGYGKPTTPTQPGSTFIQDTKYTDGRGWTNELHLFNLTNGYWTSPTTTGERPPPCTTFSFTAINHHKAVMFGGNDQKHRFNDVYIIDFRSMVWTKLERPEGATWPVERSYHPATCLNYGDDHPQLLVTGGLDKNFKTLNDGWLLDVNTGRWRELTLPEGTQPRWGHTLTACSVCPGQVHTTTFGGVPEGQLGKLDDAKQKLAETTVMEFESVQSGVGSHTSEWVLVGTIGSHVLGTPERVAQLEKMKQRKTDHELLHVYLPPPAAAPGFPTQLPAMQLIVPHVYQSTTLPVYEQTFQYSPAQFPVPPTTPTLQQQYSSGGLQEMLQEQLPTIPPIEPSLPPYYTPSRPPLPAILPPEVQPGVSSTAAYHKEASTAAAPFDQPSIFSGPLDTLWTTVSAPPSHTTYTDTPPQESPLPKQASQTADIKMKQASPKQEKPSLPDIKPKMELLPKKEPKGFKTEPKEEVEDVKFKELFSVSVDKGDLMEQLVAKNKLLAEQIAEKDQQITDQANQIAEQAKQLTEKDEQIVKYQQMYEGLMQASQVHSKQPSKHTALIHGGGMRTDVTTTEYLRGFETFAETSFVIGSHSHTLEWQRYGLKLHIPEGAVVAELRECRVDIKAGFTGQFNIPDDLQLVSCVYWLSCPQKFLKPVTLEIEHCASLQDSSQSSSLHFIVAKCSQAELPYQFRVLEKGMFAPRSSYGSIQITQFSIFGIGMFRRLWSLQRYYCTLYYIQKDINKWHIDFIITSYLQASLKVIQDRYSSLDAIPGPDFEVRFKADTISLAVPEDGICLPNGWIIIPLVPPVIEKQQVDEFKPGQRVPYCRLQVTFDKEKKPVELNHKVKLLGTNSPHDFFTITCSPEEYLESPARVKVGKRRHLEESEQQQMLKKRHLSDEYVERPATSSSGERKQLQGHKQGSQHHVSVSSSALSISTERPTVVGTPVQKPPTAEEIELTIHDLLEVTDYLLNLKQTDIYYLGLTLGLTHPHLKNMESSNTFRENMIAAWLQKEDDVARRGLPTWETLVKALRNDRVNQNGVADKIASDKNVLN